MSDNYAPKVKKASSGADGGVATYTFTVAAETWRFRAYLAFWGFVLFVKIITTIYVIPMLAAGPKVPGDTCGPFNQNETDVSPGQGFDYKTQSHLHHAFGFNNVCTNWDYTPARELGSVVYPVFEYSLLIYVAFDFLAIALAYQRGEVSPGFYKVSKVLTPVVFICCSQFRQIFVNLAYDRVEWHTAGFLGLQTALLLVALGNSYFIYDTNTAYESVGGLKGTRTLIVLYLIGNILISIPKIVATVYIVFLGDGEGPGWYKLPTFVPGMVVGRVIDMIWMLFNAIIPLFIAYFRSKNEVPIKIVFSQEAAPYMLEDGTTAYDAVGESTPLNTRA